MKVAGNFATVNKNKQQKNTQTNKHISEIVFMHKILSL